MTSRTGATLVEVLVAIFVMGIGMMALLTLFPIGVLTMRQAIQDDRAASAAANATSVAKMKIFPSKFDQWLTRADWDFPAAQQQLSSAASDGPSYPLMIDTIGAKNYLPPYSQWVGGQGLGTGIGPGVRRLTFPEPSNPNHAKNLPLIWQIAPDDIVFSKNGIPQELSPGSGVFERNSAYSWSYLMRRPVQGKVSVVETRIIVYNDRPLTLNNNLQAGETLYRAAFNAGTNTITATWGGPGEPLTPPPISIGGWILDSTPVQQSPPPALKYGPCYAKFYRVVSIVQTAGNAADFEIEGRLPSTHPATGTIVAIEGIADVFEKGPMYGQNFYE